MDQKRRWWSAKANSRYLRQIFNKLNAKYFDNKVKATIVWEDLQDRLWGDYDPETLVIRINADLHPKFKRDSQFVQRPKPPKCFLEYIVYHEMLHQIVDSVKYCNGVWNHHPPAFKKREKEFEEYWEAYDWEVGPGSHFSSNIVPYGTPGYNDKMRKWKLLDESGDKPHSKKFFYRRGVGWRIIGIVPGKAHIFAAAREYFDTGEVVKLDHHEVERFSRKEIFGESNV